MLSAESRIDLPEPPAGQKDRSVAGWRQPVTIDTYLPERPDRYPAYLEKRVYQGSSGQVYPMPFHERISQEKRPRDWDAIHLENEWVRLVILPELGGRIHIAYDKSSGYDFFYRNEVIKPALVGVLGPWISGGVEFNWPQHHRPATMLPTDSFLEFEEDGSVTAWCSDHDPFTRLKGMHGIRLRPGSAVVEARVRLFNRTEDVQTFLWWANVAAKVNDDYQSFFPTDVHFVADHAKRAISTFPAATSDYYGIDYPARVDDEHPDADRLDWYRNIPVPTSYMCIATEDDFFGGYDHGADAGFVHWADHHIAPGKKQWTWGNAPFGWAWDRNLTDDDTSYIELMAGVYTDNQPDFSYLTPGETKAFSQFWFPISGIGVVHQANLDVAAHLAVAETKVEGPTEDARAGTTAAIGVTTTARQPGSTVTLIAGGTTVWERTLDLAPDAPLVAEADLPAGTRDVDLTLTVAAGGRVLLTWSPRPSAAGTSAPPAAATEPSAPEEIASADELYLTGLHLQQYRHATRSPEAYWREALRRDPGDLRSNTALARRLYDAGRFDESLVHASAAVERATFRNPNPENGEPHYRLGLALQRLGRVEDAVDAFEKAAWNSAWRVPAWLALARIAAAAGAYGDALERVQRARRLDADHLQLRATAIVLLRILERTDDADVLLTETRRLDPLDPWIRDLDGEVATEDAQGLVDVALEYRALGCRVDALRVLDLAAARERDARNPSQNNAAPLIAYYSAEILAELGETAAAESARREARFVSAENALPARLDDAELLRRAIADDPGDARANAMLGHWLYFHHRHEEAMAHWRTAVQLDPADVVSLRNLGVASFNVLSDQAAAVDYYRRAIDVAPGDAKLRYEADQLAKRVGTAPAMRLAALEPHTDLVAHRDDLTCEYVTLLAITGRAADGLGLLTSRHFQPWEGGEGQVLAAWDATHLALARAALAEDRPSDAVHLLETALAPIASLGESRHLLANCAELWLALGDAHAAAGHTVAARTSWETAAAFTGDFQRMETQRFSERTAYSIAALQRLGRSDEASSAADDLADGAGVLERTSSRIDYFATSLPTMLLFEDDLDARRATTALTIRAQVALLRGQVAEAAALAAGVLAREPENLIATEIARETADGKVATRSPQEKGNTHS
jgi:tetratricopeptide (TPR) repeat protein